MTKFTFKREPRETGLARIGADAPSSAIKLRGQDVGLLKSPAGSRLSAAPDQWTIRFMVVRESTQDEPCPWRWATLKRRFDNEPEARAWLQSVDADALVAQLKIFIGR